MNKREELQTMLRAVDALAIAMKKKLREKARDGYAGGLDPSFKYQVAKSLQERVVELTGMCPHCESTDGEHDHEEGARQAIDVCNLAMMLWVVNGGAPRNRK
jgi:hypothetical protein